MIIGNKVFDTQNDKYIVGILNVTPDSFSDGGRYNDVDKALIRVDKMIQEGVDIIDIGGESTRPGYTKISCEEEISRVVPVIKAIKSRFDIPLSLDTYKSEVAYAGLLEGADMINDIWALSYDENMANVIAKFDASVCLMHNNKDDVYEDFLGEVLSFLNLAINKALAAGISKNKIMVDPGVGFGKNYEQNLIAIKEVARLKELGYPIMLATSRKSVIGNTLDVPKDERMIGTVATTVYGAINGCSFFRVHDILENVEAIKMTDAIMKG